MTGSRRGVVADGSLPRRADAAGALFSPRSGARLAPSALDPLPRRTFPAERPAYPRGAPWEWRVAEPRFRSLVPQIEVQVPQLAGALSACLVLAAMVCAAILCAF